MSKLSRTHTGAWCLQVEGGNPAAHELWWRQPPDVLNRLLTDLFAAQPEDILRWLHRQAWDLREEFIGPAAEASHEVATIPREHVPTERQPEDGERHEVPYFSDQLSMGEMSVLEAGSAAHPVHPMQSYQVDFSTQLMRAYSDSSRSQATASQTSPRRPTAKLNSHEVDDETGGRLTNRLNSHEVDNETGGRLTNRSSATLWGYSENSEGHDAQLARYFGKPLRQQTKSQFKGSSEPSSPNLYSEAFSIQIGDVKSDPWLVLNPVGQFRILWDCIFFTFLAYEIWATPVELFFFDCPSPPWFIVISNVVIVFFCLDIVLNFNTGFVQDGTIIMSRVLIARHYLHTWFWLDFTATLPELVAFAFGDAFFLVRFSRGVKAYKMLKGLRLLRTFRLMRTQTFANMAMRHFEVGPVQIFLLRMCQLHWVLVLVVHFHAVCWALLDYQPQNTPTKAFVRYLDSAWAVFPALSLGGSLEITVWKHEVMGIFVALERVSFIMMALKWMLWRAMLMQDDAEQTSVREGALAYLKHHRASPALQIKVFQNLQETGRVRRHQQDFHKLLNQAVPPQMRRLICDELWSEKLMTLDLIHSMASLEAEFLKELAMVVEEVVMGKEVVLFVAGEDSKVAYYILQGILSVTFHESESNVPDYTTGMWVGEKALVNPELRRIQTMVCKVWTELMALTAADFAELLDQFDLRQRFHDLLATHLWLGLCGRCGILGDHFSHDCPLLSQSGKTGRYTFYGIRVMSRPVSRPSLVRRRLKRNDESRKDLARFLNEHHIMRLWEVLVHKYGVKCLNDLKLSIIEQLRADPEVQLSQQEWQVLSEYSIKEYRRKIKRATTLILQKTTVGDDQHLIFLSHYKVEAGTEAALMQEDLVRLIHSDTDTPGHDLKLPVFLDSEDLRDLSQLKHHVNRSHNLFLLLTPNVLKRPWCLIEIVEARRHNVRVVPIEVQRPGLTFRYPDEVYFKRMASGQELDKGATELLQREGIALAEVEGVLRQVFQAIAKPFSPHKTKEIRQAELRDVLKLCQLKKDGSGSGALSNARSSSHREESPVRKEGLPISLEEQTSGRSIRAEAGRMKM